MDVENRILEEYIGKPLFAYDNEAKENRLEDEKWMNHAEKYIKDRYHPSELTFEEYKQWVKAGGGDFWTSKEKQEENANFWDIIQKS
jgi:hypothetical protein